MLVDGGPQIALSVDDVVQYSRPSIDVLFESAADIYGARLLGVLLTGGNEDGAAGMAYIAQCGGSTVVQDPAEALAAADARRRAESDETHAHPAAGRHPRSVRFPWRRKPHDDDDEGTLSRPRARSPVLSSTTFRRTSSRCARCCRATTSRCSPRNPAPQALEILLEKDVALAILDVQMPEMNGFELAELMRGTERTRDIPIFFVTAGTRDQERLFRGYEAGAVDFIYKPIEADILKNKASVFFQLHRQKQQLAWELHERTEALRLSEMFMAVLGHDLRNPLGAIMASAEVAGMASKDDQVKQFTARILSSAQRMTRMIEDLLDVTRARVAGGIPIRPEPMDLQPVLDRVLERTARDPSDARDRGHRARRPARHLGQRTARAGSLEPGHERACSTARRTRRSPSKPTAAPRAKSRLCVRNGGSIPEHRRAALFDPFHDVSRMAESRNGLGLGLYIVREIVLAHGGSVDVHAGSTDETAFWVRLPRVAKTERSREPLANDKHGMEGRRIAWERHDHGSPHHRRRSRPGTGDRGTAARARPSRAPGSIPTNAASMRCAIRDDIAIVLLDLQLGQQRGESLIEDLRREGTRLPPLLIFSAQPMNELRHAATMISAAGILQKPCDAAAINHAIETAVG